MNIKNSWLIICILLISFASFATIDAVTIKDVSTSPEEIVPGEIASVSIEIENIFEDPVENLKIKLVLENVPFAPYQSSSEEFLDELDDGDEEKFTFKLIALPDTASGIYKIPVLISYNENETEEGLISLTVNSKPELKVSLEDSVVLIKGKENEIIIKIINSGLSDAKFVYLETSEVSGIKFLTNKEQYIGDVDSDDFDSVKYKIHLDSNALNSINLPVILKYKDATNKEYTETETIILKAYSLKEARVLGLVEKKSYGFYILIGVFSGGYFVYRIIKKRKLKKKRGD
jgi:hypothetical protein